MPADKKKATFFLLLIILLVVVSALLLRLSLLEKEGIQTQDGVKGKDIKDSLLVDYENESIEAYEVIGTLLENPRIDKETQFTLLKLGVETNSGKMSELDILAFLVPGPGGERSVPVTVKESLYEGTKGAPSTLYSEDEMISFLKDYVGRRISVVVVVGPSQRHMEEMLDEIISGGCSGMCISMANDVKGSLSETTEAIGYLLEKDPKFNGLTINTLVAHIYVEK